MIKQVVGLVCILVSIVTQGQIVRSYELSQERNVIKCVDTRGRFIIEIERSKDSAGYIVCSLINTSPKVLGYYSLLWKDYFGGGHSETWSPTHVSLEPTPYADVQDMVLIHPKEKRTYAVDIGELPSYTLSMTFCIDAQTYIDSTIRKYEHGWNRINISSPKLNALSIPVDISPAFVTAKVIGLSNDTVKHKTLKFVVQN